MSNSRTIAVIGSSLKRKDTYEFSAENVSSASVGSDIDPVISIDHFRMRKSIFAPHPHAGFSAITYLFEDSEGEFINRDSLGNYHIAKPGAVVWNVTGSGVIHEEFPKYEGKLSHGLQVFINLAGVEKMRAPHIMFVDGPDVARYEEEGKHIRVVAGRVGDTIGKIQPPGGITFLDIKLDPGVDFEQVLPPDDNVLLYVIEGGVLVGNEGKPLYAHFAASLNFDGDGVLLKALAEGVHMVLISGKPLRESVVMQGPFIMNTEDQIIDAFERFKGGEMGRIVPERHNYFH